MKKPCVFLTSFSGKRGHMGQNFTTALICNRQYGIGSGKSTISLN